MSDQIKTLRDEFAMEWMKGVLASPRQTTTDRESFAECAYRMADAMLEARQKKIGKFHTERQALQDNLKPEFVVVPRVATEKMIKACLQSAIDFLNEHKATEVYPGKKYPNPTENARRCWAAMVQAALGEKE